MNLTEMKAKPINELVDIAESLGIEDVGRLKSKKSSSAYLNNKPKKGWIFMVEVS